MGPFKSSALNISLINFSIFVFITKFDNKFIVQAQLNINIDKEHFFIISIFGVTLKFLRPILTSSKLNIGNIESKIVISVFII